jgi:hypothetical protein
VDEDECLLAEVFAGPGWRPGAVKRFGAESIGLEVFAGPVDALLLAPFDALRASEDIAAECGGDSGLGIGEIVLVDFRSLFTTFEAKWTFLVRWCGLSKADGMAVGCLDVEA